MDDIPEELTQYVVNELHNHGIEKTPDEVNELRKKAFATIRAEMLRRGYKMPDSDMELLMVLIAAGLTAEDFKRK